MLSLYNSISDILFNTDMKKKTNNKEIVFDDVFDENGRIKNREKLRIINKTLFSNGVGFVYLAIFATSAAVVMAICYYSLSFVKRLIEFFNRFLNNYVSMIIGIMLFIILLVILIFLLVFIIYLIAKRINKNKREDVYQEFLNRFIKDQTGKEREKTLVYSCYKSLSQEHDSVSKRRESFANIIKIIISVSVSVFIIDRIQTNNDSYASIIAKFIVTLVVYYIADKYEAETKECIDIIGSIIGNSYESMIRYYKAYIDLGYSESDFIEYEEKRNLTISHPLFDMVEHCLNNSIVKMSGIIMFTYKKLISRIRNIRRRKAK